ncbi:MAG: LamG-like jellyroll fold domain-containing protein [Vicinamibacterales bacterium]
MQLPVIVLVLAFTAVPLELRPLSRDIVASALDIHLDLGDLDLSDVVANIAGYAPVGIVLSSLGAWSAVGASAALSICAEVSQLFSLGRAPAAIDVATNVIGAVLGLVLTARWKTRWRIAPPQIEIGRRGACLAAALALAYVGVGTQLTPRSVEETMKGLAALPGVAGLPSNDRGATTPGRLEAHWTFDGGEDAIAPDASGNGLNGVLINQPTFVPGIDGLALRLNGANQYADFGDPLALRLTGSMTISAWVNSSSFPVDDAAIVSGHSGLGYQLDTTVDQGPRTIGFKLANEYGRLVARYGRTPLKADTWYHVVGVYDAGARTMSVYLNGRLDNGCLLGTVTSTQRLSGVKVYVGRRGRGEGFEFAGSIDDVQVYSRALTQRELDAETRRTMTTSSVPPTGNAPTDGSAPEPAVPGACSPKGGADAKVVGLIVAFGLLVGVACAGFWPTPACRGPCLIAGVASGLLLYSSGITTLPPGDRWMIPLFTLLGGIVAAASIRTASYDEPRS